MEVTRKIVSLLVLLSVFGAVISIDYYISPFGSDNNSGTSPTAPFKTFYIAQSRMASGSVLNVLPGLYSGSENANVYWDNSVTIVSQDGPVQTIVVGPGTWTIADPVSIEGIQFTNFNNPSQSVFNLYYSSFTTSLTLDNVYAYNNNLVVNIADDNIYVSLYNSNFTSNTMIVSHSSDEGYNGGVHVENSTFSQNAGGIVGFYDSVKIINSTFLDQSCSYPGCALSLNQSTSVTINTTEFTNSISSANGGAIYFATTVKGVVILNSAFISNTAVNGGAIYSDDSIEISGSKFEKNYASGIGGAIYLNGISGTSMGATVTEVLFDRNTAQTSAGAVYCTNSVVSYQSVDFFQNYAPVGSSYQCGPGCSTYVFDVYSQGNTPSC